MEDDQAPSGYEVEELPGLGKVYRCKRCGAVLVSKEDVKSHERYHSSK